MKKLGLVVAILLSAQTSFARLNCFDLFAKPFATAEHVKVDREPIPVSKELRQALAKYELPLYSDRLEQLTLMNGGVLTTEALKAFYDSLYFPAALSEPRLRAARHLSEKNILAILGDLNLKETTRLFVGESSDVVAKDSLLGRYLEESGAKLQRRPFTEFGRAAPGRELRTGPERFLVPVDATTFPIFQKYFSNEQVYTIFGHGHLLWKGKLLFQMGAFTEQEFGFSPKEQPLPMVLLKTTEGQRMKRYVKAFQSYPQNGRWGAPDPVVQPNQALGWDNPARAPWSYIPSTNGGRYMEGRSKYNCCAHWQGNIPLGDKLVTEITLPGVGADYATDAPQIVKLNPPDYSNPALAPVKDVWTYPMHEPISSILGLAKNNGEGEFASAGWAIQSLLMSAPAERVPFVFLLTNDAKAEVPADVRLHFENPF